MNKNKHINTDEFVFSEDCFPKLELPESDDIGINLEELLGFDFVEYVS